FQAVGITAGPQSDIGCNLGQEKIAADQPLPFGVIEAQMTVGVSRCVKNLILPVAEADRLPPLDVGGLGMGFHPLAEVAQMFRDPGRPILRSEEHTSELQSRENLVCRLLLEKKNMGIFRQQL